MRETEILTLSLFCAFDCVLFFFFLLRTSIYGNAILSTV